MKPEWFNNVSPTFYFASYYNFCWIKFLEKISVNLHVCMMYAFFLMMRTSMMYSFSSFQICSTDLLTIGTMMYMTPPWLTYFITGILYLLIPFIHFCLSSLYKFSVFFVCFKFHIWVRSHDIYLSDLFHFSLMPSRFICVVANDKIFLFYGCIVFHCVCVCVCVCVHVHFLYPFFHLDYCK